MTSIEQTQLIQREGWQLFRVKGSHHIFKHPDKPGRVVLYHSRSSLPIAACRSILRQAGV